ncbi:MAG TPA: molybdopterin-synthase adenylyltransferase MoeB [Gammaproteobacteria bacterium]|nr:molybdopterin-synthase adenylyltransferase MoeB [Gammaproteobacteria bacterium]
MSSERYSRHLLLPQIGERGQARLRQARVLVIGLGGLGSPVAMYLAASGVGHLVLVDFDHVELSNLQRQVIHSSADIGRDKVESAGNRVAALNPEVRVTTFAYVLDDDELADEIARADVVVDASDNFETRFVLNAFCYGAGTPLVSGAAIRMEGQVGVFDPRDPDSGCYRCLYTDESGEGEACSQVGVLAPLLGIIGSVQATEALKLIVGTGRTLAGRLLVLDALEMEWRMLKLPRDPKCPVCGPQTAARTPGGDGTAAA